MTTHELARETGNGISTITRWARELGIPRRGRDYQLTNAEAQAIRNNMRSTSGRPRTTQPGARRRSSERGRG